jgi:hypothetical protein
MIRAAATLSIQNLWELVKRVQTTLENELGKKWIRF